MRFPVWTQIAAGLGLAVLGVVALRCASGTKPSSGVAVVETPRKRTATDAAPAPSAELQAAVTKIFEQWRDGKVDALYAEANQGFRDAVALPVLVRFLDEEDDRLGAFERVETMERGEPEEGLQVVTGEARFTNGVGTFEMYFAGTGPAPVLHHLNFHLPAELGGPPPVEEAAKTARRALDALLAGDVETYVGLLAAEDELTEEDKAGLVQLRARLGAVTSVEQTRDEDCEEVRRCVEFRIVGAKQGGVASFELDVNLTRWQLYGFAFELEKGAEK